MKKCEIKARIQKDWPLYLAAGMIILVMRYFGRTSDTDILLWILAPTARWAGILGGISFEYLPHQGYVNHFYQFLIAASCSGIRFMLLTFLMFLFMPVYAPKEGMRRKYGRLVSSMILAYCFTIFVNGIRIVLAIRIPILLEELHLLQGWLTPDRLHTLVGTVTYFTALCVIYRLMASDRSVKGLRVPLFWYLLLVLALPFVSRMWHQNWQGFGQYAAAVMGVCMSVCMIFCVVKKRKTALFDLEKLVMIPCKKTGKAEAYNVVLSCEEDNTDHR